MKTYRYYVHALNFPTNYEIAKQFGLGEDAMYPKKQCFIRRKNKVVAVRILDLYVIDEQTLMYLKQDNPTLQYQLFVQEGNGQIRSMPEFSKKKVRLATAESMLTKV